MIVMEKREKAPEDVDGGSIMPGLDDLKTEDPNAESQPENQEALAHLQKARQRMYSAAIAYCEGHISAGQLRAVRELLRSHEQHYAELGEVILPSFIDDLTRTTEAKDDAAVAPTPEITPQPEPVEIAPPLQSYAAKPKPPAFSTGDTDEPMRLKLDSLERKLFRLEDSVRDGDINPAQYRAISRHYEEQRTVAIRLHERHPGSEKWRMVLQDGKTNFLMQVHEAICYGVAVYDYSTNEPLYLEGKLPENSQDGIALLGAFGGPATGDQSEHMYATEADDGSALLLIPGRHTAALVSFSQEPPEWQARALREVHRNFEDANRAVFEQALARKLVFPDLSNFIRPSTA